jgi:hypothetical protein
MTPLLRITTLLAQGELAPLPSVGGVTSQSLAVKASVQGHNVLALYAVTHFTDVSFVAVKYRDKMSSLPPCRSLSLNNNLLCFICSRELTWRSVSMLLGNWEAQGRDIQIKVEKFNLLFFLRLP